MHKYKWKEKNENKIKKKVETYLKICLLAKDTQNIQNRPGVCSMMSMMICGTSDDDVIAMSLPVNEILIAYCAMVQINTIQS